MYYDIESINIDCYEGTSCLINKFDIKDEKILSKIEAEISFAKSVELLKNPLIHEFNTEYYKSIHKYLFSDLYDWAGKYRKINISKKGTKFVDYDKLEILSDRIFLRLKELDFFRGMSFSEFINEIVDIYCSLNMLHPFREGNGRTQRIFISELLKFNGYTINFSEINKDELMIATIYSAQGVNDYLRAIFEQNII